MSGYEEGIVPFYWLGCLEAVATGHEVMCLYTHAHMYSNKEQIDTVYYEIFDKSRESYQYATIK